MAVPLTYHDLIQHKEQLAQLYTVQGNLSSQVPVALTLLFLPLFSLLVPHARALRLVAWLAMIHLGIILTRSLRGRFLGQGFFIGLWISSAVVHVGVQLVLSYPERDFLRLERTRHPAENCGVLELKNGETIHWQSYPKALLHRLHWSVGLLLSRQGTSWNWRVQTLPPLPVQLQGPLLYRSRPRHRGNDSPKKPQFGLMSLLILMLKKYLLLDLVTFPMRRDPYFWGMLKVPPLPQSPLHVVVQWPLILWACRMLLGFIAFKQLLELQYIALQLLSWGMEQVAPRLGVCFLPTSKDQPWLHAPLFGSSSAVLDYGLAGCWGSYWHQQYRFDGLMCSEAIISLCPAWVRQNVGVYRFVTMVNVFFLVGATHACASYTQIGPTQPFRREFLFFMVQPLGILIQKALIAAVPDWLRDRPWLARRTNFLYVVLWFFICGRPACDDFASGGFWASIFPPSPLCAVFSVEGNEEWYWGF